MIGSTFWEIDIIGSKLCGKNMIGSTFWQKKPMTDSTYGKKHD
jgi:hypothetical protein